MIFLENYLIKVLMQITWCCRRSTCVLLAHRIVDCVLANHNKASKASKPQNYKLISITVCVFCEFHSKNSFTFSPLTTADIM